MNKTCERYFGLRLIKCGVNSILSGISDYNFFIATIRNIMQGKNYYPPEIRESIESREYLLVPEYTCPITKREFEVLDFIVEGKTIQETASILNIAYGTVAKMRTKIMRKLGAVNSTGAVSIAIANGYAQSKRQ
jgi:DNA-binding NarL/FixJ family response regulator